MTWLAVRAFIEAYWKPIAIAALILSALGYVAFLRAEIDHYRTAAADARATLDTIKSEGEKAKREADAQKLADQNAKEAADHENDIRISALNDTIIRLRKQHPDTSFVPAAPAGSRDTSKICFDRAEYIRADGDFTAAARGLADEGSTATVNLDTSKNWAQHK